MFAMGRVNLAMYVTVLVFDRFQLIRIRIICSSFVLSTFSLYFLQSELGTKNT